MSGSLYYPLLSLGSANWKAVWIWVAPNSPTIFPKEKHLGDIGAVPPDKRNQVSCLRVWMSESARCLKRQLSGNFGHILEPVYPIYSKMEERSRGPWVRDSLSLSLTHSSNWMDMSNLSTWSSYCSLVYPSERPDSFPCHSHFFLQSFLRPYCCLVTSPWDTRHSMPDAL